MKQIRNSKLGKRMHGGTLLGFMLGLVIGLGVAVVVAIFVTRAPVPFMNKTNKAAERVMEGRTNNELPDPNKSMYGKQRQANPGSAPGSAAPSSNDTPPGAPAPAAPTPPQVASPDPAVGSSGLGGILSKDAPPPPVVVPPPPPPSPSAGKDPISDAIKGNTASIEDRTSYQLQAGAFRQQEDAESMKAKLSLLGYESRILNAQVNGETLYRVRVGPYKQFDDMNKAKSRMAENRIEVTVIKIKPAN